MCFGLFFILDNFMPLLFVVLLFFIFCHLLYLYSFFLLLLLLLVVLVCRLIFSEKLFHSFSFHLRSFDARFQRNFIPLYTSHSQPQNVVYIKPSVCFFFFLLLFSSVCVRKCIRCFFCSVFLCPNRFWFYSAVLVPMSMLMLPCWQNNERNWNRGIFQWKHFHNFHPQMLMTFPWNLCVCVRVCDFFFSLFIDARHTKIQPKRKRKHIETQF